MEKQHSRILTALAVIGVLSLPLAAESLTGSGAAGSSGSVGGNGGNAGGVVGGNVGTNVDSTMGSGADGTVGGAVSGGNANGAAGTAVNADANGGAKSGVSASDASTGMVRSDADVRGDFRAFSNRLDTLDKRIDADVTNNVYTLKEAAERRADLADLRSRLRTKAGHIRHLTIRQRDRLESAISAQEKSLTVDESSDTSSDTNSSVNQQ